MDTVEILHFIPRSLLTSITFYGANIVVGFLIDDTITSAHTVETHSNGDASICATHRPPRKVLKETRILTDQREGFAIQIVRRGMTPETIHQGNVLPAAQEDAEGVAMSKVDKKSYCYRCRQNFYNANNDFGIKECWHFKTAKVVWKEVYYSPSDVKAHKIRTLDCHSNVMY